MKVLFTAGLGDFIAIDSWLPSQFKEQVKTIFWATRARSLIQQSINMKTLFPNLKDQIILHDDWCSADEWNATGGDMTTGRPFCIARKEELHYLKVDLSKYSTILDELVDLSVTKVFEMIEQQNLPYVGTQYTTQVLGDVSRFGLPTQYVCIHPYSSNALTDHRDFSLKDWRAVSSFLIRNHLQAVVIGSGKGRVPVPYRMHTIKKLIDGTSIGEAMEITKHATYFIGAASTFSVLASKCLGQDKVFIKGHHSLNESTYWPSPGADATQWCYPLRKFYYSPLTEDSTFVHQDLSLLNTAVI